MSKDDSKEQIIKIFSTLTPAEKESLKKKLNIGSDNQKDSEQVERDINTTRKKIREIEKKALKMLRDDLPDDVA